MAQKNRTTLKTYFEVGDKPTENQFEDLIDSCVNNTDDNATTTQKGIAERATQGEVTTGTDDARYVTPKGAKHAAETHAPVLSVNGQTGAVIVGDDTGWLSISLLSNFIDFSPNWQSPRYRKKNGVVYLEGMAKNGTPDPAPMFVLPSNCRPSGKLLFSAIGNNVVSRVNIDNTGIVTVSNLQTQWTSISGISFLAD